jgi:hypothetical protein
MTRILANVMRIIERGDQKERLFGIAAQEGNTCLPMTNLQFVIIEWIFRRK